MKYNEAIDMILDGGEAYPKQFPNHKISFIDWLLCSTPPDGGEYVKYIIFSETYIRRTDWLVKKDGVVYHELPPVNVSKCGSPICRDIIRNCYECQRDNEMCPPHNYFRANNKCYDLSECTCEYGVKFIKDRIHEQDEPAELEESNKLNKELYDACANVPWPENPVLFDGSVDEDWLEKKMLCFLLRYTIQDSRGGLYLSSQSRENKCQNPDWCSYCYPKDHISDASNMVEKEKKCNYDKKQSPYLTTMTPGQALATVLNECFDQPREKVTVEDILYLINGVVGAEIADTMALFCPNYDEETRIKMRKGSSEALDSWGCKLKQKLEYLVSLQDKEA